MINTNPNHKHTYDKDGKMTCCSQEEKINHLADKSLKNKQKKDSCCKTVTVSGRWSSKVLIFALALLTANV